MNRVIDETKSFVRANVYWDGGVSRRGKISVSFA